MRSLSQAILMLAATCPLAAASDYPETFPELPQLQVTRDNTVVDRSCLVVIATGTVIEDTDGNGVLHIAGDDIVVEFAEGSVLRGPLIGVRPDLLQGIGVRLDGHARVKLRHLDVRGFKIGILASRTFNLEISESTFSDNFRQELCSSSLKEDAADWLWPHDNDAHQWRDNYGAAICIENSTDASLSSIKVRDTQNGIILDRVMPFQVRACDCSFLSGWGLALWRSAFGLIDNNAFDFCIRGYSHGRYNRGQDSAGILMFEQCHDINIWRNSLTHCGDGFFGFAGKDALGEEGQSTNGRLGAGNSNINVFYNDMSFSAAHGLEMTFSRDNHIEGNLFERNGICGVWGGYSYRTTIFFNAFIGNGDRGSRFERGGINIEHGHLNTIAHNTFMRDVCGVHLWWDNDAGLFKLPWAIVNGRGIPDEARPLASFGEWITRNRFESCPVAIELRDVTACRVGGNEFTHVGEDMRITPGSTRDDSPASRPLGSIWQIDKSRDVPLGPALVTSRVRFGGRKWIMMTAWGPLDVERSDPANAETRVP